MTIFATVAIVLCVIGILQISMPDDSVQGVGAIWLAVGVILLIGLFIFIIGARSGYSA